MIGIALADVAALLGARIVTTAGPSPCPPQPVDVTGSRT
jgi:hypothetical protein